MAPPNNNIWFYLLWSPVIIVMELFKQGAL